MRLGNPGRSGIASQTRPVRGCGKLPAHAVGHHCLPVLKRNSPPLPQNSCQYQENDLETDTSVRKPRNRRSGPRDWWNHGSPRVEMWQGRRKATAMVGHVIFSGISKLLLPKDISGTISFNFPTWSPGDGLLLDPQGLQTLQTSYRTAWI